MQLRESLVTPSATTRFHTTATHAVPSTTETPEHHFAAVANTITPEDWRIRLKHVELYNTCNNIIHWLHQVGYSFTLMGQIHSYGTQTTSLQSN
jgi:hypothetical protein